MKDEGLFGSDWWIPARRGSRSEGAKLPHGYVAEKTNPGASASGGEGTEKKPIVFRLIGFMQRSPYIKGER
jgi:hypothetical protein